MKHTIFNAAMRALPVVALALLAGGCAEEDESPVVTPSGEGFALVAECGDMLPQFVDPTDVASRAGDGKDPEEKQINSLHVFFFDSQADANGKHPLVESTDLGFDAYQRKDGTNILSVPDLDKVFDKLGGRDIEVRALANLSGGYEFKTPVTPDGDMKGVHRDAGDADDVVPQVYPITCLEDLNDWVYCPVLRSEEGTTIDQLPKAGMPMVGERTVRKSDYADGQSKNLKIPMRAMMARIDLRIKLEPDNRDPELGLPRMTITEYGVMNMPTRVPFISRNGGSYTEEADTTNQPLEKFLTKKEPRQLTEGDVVRFHYYTYENVRQPYWDAVRTNGEPAFNGDRTAINYPAGVSKDEEKQRWKPTVARKWSASAIIIKGEYVTHQNLTYQAQFTIFIGDNTVDDFKVRRNRQYVNNITIKGLDYVRNSDDGVYTFDGRVNVVSDNAIYISVVNERKVDAHASVLPMDIFFMRPLEEDGSVPDSEVEVSLIDPNTGTAPDWIRLEKIPGRAMESGVWGSEADFIQGMDNGDGTKRPYSPGTGARRYFTHDLVTNTLSGNTSTIVSRRADDTRTRVYFYIDENVPNRQLPDGEDWPGRDAVVYITYRRRDAGGTVVETRPRTLDIEQRGLLRVQGNGNGRNIDFFIEYYEEYMGHNDPLDMHEIPGQVYEGLQWCKPDNGNASFETDGAYRSWINDRYDVNGLYWAGQRYRSYNIYGEKDGYWMTDFMMNGRTGRRPITLVKTYNRTLDEQPPTAFHYCYGKNKRTADGEVYRTGKTGYWYMLGITEIETAMEKYYTTFQDFQNKLYWSAASGERNVGTIFERSGEDPDRARATKTDASGVHIESGMGAVADGDESISGRQRRTKTYRIRAGYIYNP